MIDDFVFLHHAHHLQPSNSIQISRRPDDHLLPVTIMDENPEKPIEAIPDEEPRLEPVASSVDEYDEKPRQDPVSSAVDEYLDLVNPSTQSSPPSSNHGNAIFKDITAWAGDSESEFLQTVTNIFLAPVALLQKILSTKKPLEKTILHGINGIVQEGEMLLVLGRPGSGCTTLLKTLSGLSFSRRRPK